MKSICVVLVTFNRKELLAQLLAALPKQTYPIAAIVILDNNSTDGTGEMLRDMEIISDSETGKIHVNVWNNIQCYYYRNRENTGGSGGFATVFSIAKRLPYDLIWAMDDDVMPEMDCLELLVRNISSEAECVIPSRSDDNWQDYAVTDYNLSNPFLYKLDQIKTKIDGKTIKEPFVNIVDMPLEGPLMTMALVKKIGIPDKRYFIMFDDTDFAYRASLNTNVRYIPEATLHRVLAKKTSAVMNEWTWKTFYLIRNQFFFDRKYGKNILVRYFRPWWSMHVKCFGEMMKKHPERIKWIRRAYKEANKGIMGKTLAPGTEIR